MNITQLLFKNFIRNKGFIVSLILLFVTSLLSLYIGKTFIDNYNENIQKSAQLQQETIERYVKFENKEMGLLLYYLKFGLVNKMPPLAGLSIGQRDINPSVMSVTIRNLEEQKYNTELNNPMYQLLGNMDFSFVLIYFFPLVIIAFTFNILSEEKESGIWKLICSQTSRPFLIIFKKVFIRLFVILVILILILIIAKIYLQIPFNIVWVAFCILSISYVLFWFSLSFWVISFQKKSNQNALLLLLFWILLTIVLPATANAFVVKTYPTQEAFQTMIESRDAYHKKWDLPKEPTIQKFKTHYPKFNNFKHPQDKDFSWFWYYAMQQMGDDEAQKHTKQLKIKLTNREKVSKYIGRFFPTIHTQLFFNQLAQSDLTNQLQFWKALEQFHEKKRLYFYPKIFNNESVIKEHWEQWKLDAFQDSFQINWAEMILPIFFISAFIFILAIIRLRKIII